MRNRIRRNSVEESLSDPKRIWFCTGVLLHQNLLSPASCKELIAFASLRPGADLGIGLAFWPEERQDLLHALGEGKRLSTICAFGALPAERLRDLPAYVFSNSELERILF